MTIDQLVTVEHIYCFFLISLARCQWTVSQPGKTSIVSTQQNVHERIFWVFFACDKKICKHNKKKIRNIKGSIFRIQSSSTLLWFISRPDIHPSIDPSIHPSVDRSIHQ